MNASPGGFSAVESIQANGAIMTMLPSVRARYASARSAACVQPRRAASARAAVAAASVIVHPAALDAPLHDRDQEDDHEQRPGDRRGVAHLQELEPLVV